MVSSTPRPHFTSGKDTLPILQEAGWAPGPVRTGGKSRPNRHSIPDRPARSQSLYRLSYPAQNNRCTRYNFLIATDRSASSPSVCAVTRLDLPCHCLKAMVSSETFISITDLFNIIHLPYSKVIQVNLF